MTRDEKVNLFSNELSWMRDDRIREFTAVIIENAPEYFFSVPASSSGKYHPPFDLGEGGLVRHTRCVAYFAKCMAESMMFSAHDTDLVILGAIAHDIKKQGDGAGRHTVTEHPILASKYIRETYYACTEQPFTPEDLDKVCNAVESHMGIWGSKDGLPLPKTEFDKALQAADYIASRKTILSFDFAPVDGAPDYSVPIPQEPVINESLNVNPAEYVLNFGKHKGKTLAEAEPTGYLDWMVKQEDFFNREAQDMARRYLQEKNTRSTQPQPAPSIPTTSENIDDLPF